MKKNKKTRVIDGKEYEDRRVSLKDEEKEIIESLRATGVVPNQHLISSDRNIIKIKENYEELRKRYSGLLKEHEKLQEVFNFATEIENMKFNKMKIKPKSTKTAVGEATAVFMASDWHVGERVTLESVSNLNVYNPQTARARAHSFFRKGLFLTDVVRKGIKIRDLVLYLGGDFLSGYIHKELEESNYMSPIEETMFATELLSEGIDFLLDEGGFDTITVPCSVGNHARTTEKFRISTEHQNNFEYLMYMNIAKMYRNNPRIRFIIPKSYFTYYTVYDRFKLRCHHGHACKFYGGVSGISLVINKSINLWNKQEREKVYIDLVGHFHQSNDFNNCITNGSVVGYNAFALTNKFPFEEPCQQFFTIDKERGKTFVAPIFVN